MPRSPKPTPTVAAPQAANSPLPSEPRVTKQALLLDLLRRDIRASLDEMGAATGWLAHTTRAALTSLRKKGIVIEKRRMDGASRYTTGA